jgi:hypothetical protein
MYFDWKKILEIAKTIPLKVFEKSLILLEAKVCRNPVVVLNGDLMQFLSACLPISETVSFTVLYWGSFLFSCYGNDSQECQSSSGFISKSATLYLTLVNARVFRNLV